MPNQQLIHDGEQWVPVIHHYEYGIFNADKDKICAANDTTPDAEEWKWLYESPFDIRSTEDNADYTVDTINESREKAGMLETHGPVMWRRRLVSYGPWEQKDE